MVLHPDFQSPDGKEKERQAGGSEYAASVATLMTNGFEFSSICESSAMGS